MGGLISILKIMFVENRKYKFGVSQAFYNE